MRFAVILRYIGTVLLCIAGFMVASSVISAVAWHSYDNYPLQMSALLTLLLGLFPVLFVPKPDHISTKEGFVIVTGSWITACIVGSFPYLIYGFSIMDAWFESVSGFTATGATILGSSDFATLPQSLLLWRAITCWIGGAGVVMFALVVLPSLGTSKMALSSVELSSMAKDNYSYRTMTIVKILFSVYVGLTICTILSLKWCGMRWLDALCQGLSVCATGGFTTKASIAEFDSPLIEGVLMCAMFISSLHFGLIYATIIGRSRNIFRSEVVRAYVGVIVVATVIVASNLYLNDIYDALSALRHALFQVMSLITTTGFATADTTLWPPLAILVLLLLSVVCACAGSTSGGIKIDRLLLAWKVIVARVRRQQHPDAIVRVRIDGVLQEENKLHLCMEFIAAYAILVGIGTFVCAACGHDLLTSFSSSIACTSNVGPGFGVVGSMGSYGELHPVVKLTSTLLMLAGRLEIFGLIQLLFIRLWR